jgi:hypothetical protein
MSFFLIKAIQSYSLNKSCAWLFLSLHSFFIFKTNGREIKGEDPLANKYFQTNIRMKKNAQNFLNEYDYIGLMRKNDIK